MIEKRGRERSRNGGKKRVPYRVAERKIKRRKKKGVWLHGEPEGSKRVPELQAAYCGNRTASLGSVQEEFTNGDLILQDMAGGSVQRQVVPPNPPEPMNPD